jgi:hypothetical protein
LQSYLKRCLGYNEKSLSTNEVKLVFPVLKNKKSLIKTGGSEILTFFSNKI